MISGQNIDLLNKQGHKFIIITREMALSRKIRKDKVFQEVESEDNPKMDEGKSERHDYISLKNKVYKTKVENQEQLLQYYTTQKFNQYFKTLTPGKATYTAETQQEIKELEEMVQAGHNICVFGRGSKIQLLKSLHKKKLSNYPAFEVKGYLPSVTDKKIYSHFAWFLVDIQYTKKTQKITLREQVVEFHEILKDSNKGKVVVIVHSIDGPNLLNSESQQKLCDLFDHPNIQLICSLDSIKMVMNWSPITLQKYKFLFFNIDTKQPYIEELKYRPLKNESRESTEDSLMYVWQSLNRNQKHITKFIAANELKNIGVQENETTHYTFNDLLDICIEEIVLSSDHQLRQNLLELLDHKIIIQRTDEKKNKKIYLMKYQKRMLEKIMEMKAQ